MTKKELQRAIFEAPEDAEIILLSEDRVFSIESLEVATKETRSIHSPDISLLEHQIRAYIKPLENKRVCVFSGLKTYKKGNS